MNEARRGESRDLRAWHEHAMEKGQHSYFTLDRRGELVPRPDQRAWLDTHLRKAARLLAIEPCDLFVDLGCGEGYLTRPLSSRAGLGVGIDFSSGALGVFRSRPSFDPRRLGLVLAAGDAIPLPDGSVDRVLCNHVLEHVLDDAAVIREIGRVLRPGGRALIGVPLAYTPQTIFLIRLRRFLRPRSRLLRLEPIAPGRLRPELIGVQSHIRFYSLSAIRSLLERHGFRVLRAEGVGLAARGPLAPRLRRSRLLLE
ncbi:MAG: methyltransferase domain-containing protein, partial [Candidatus Krumholzibacteria bacterium]|nr:methyltransferase domain-containing protein [Candidatus Krumholzibacteria bacterium]